MNTATSTKTKLPRQIHPYNSPLKVVREYFSKAKIDRSRGHEAHIRITNMDDEAMKTFNKMIADNKLMVEGSIQDRNYSTAYQTTFITIDNEFIPFVLAHKDMKINQRDSLIQKQLTPKKLGILGQYNSAQEILDQLKKSFKQIVPSLNSSWKSWKPTELKNLLLKIAYDIVYNNQEFNPREQSILTANQASIGKDFGEILSAIYIAHKFGNVEIEKMEATANFDLSYTDKDTGEVFRLNTKSGNGSGQSFTAFASQLMHLDFSKEKNADIATSGKIMQNLCDKSISGRAKIFKNAQLTRSSNSPIAKVMDDISIMMFKNGEIKAENFQGPATFSEYVDILTNILESHNFKLLGIPVGSKEATADTFYEKNANGPENAILFSLATLTANFFPQEAVNQVMKKKLKQSIFVLNVKINEQGAVFELPQTPNYRFHYWGNFKSPTNNLPGYKTIF